MKKGKFKASAIAANRNPYLSNFPSIIPSKERIDEFQQKLKSKIEVHPDYGCTLQESAHADLRTVFPLTESKLEYSPQTDISYSKKAVTHLLKNSVHIYELLRLHARGEGKLSVKDEPIEFINVAYAKYHVIVSGFCIGGHDILVRSYCAARGDKHDANNDFVELQRSVINGNLCCEMKATSLGEKSTHLVIRTYIDLMDNVYCARYLQGYSEIEYVVLPPNQADYSLDSVEGRLQSERTQVSGRLSVLESESIGWLD